MTRKDIIRMAREAGINTEQGFLSHYDLERFAVLVLANTPHESSMAWKKGFESGAAAEREQIIAKNVLVIDRINEHIKTLEDAVAAEREACAKVCESAGPGSGPVYCAFAIRARK